MAHVRPYGEKSKTMFNGKGIVFETEIELIQKFRNEHVSGNQARRMANIAMNNSGKRVIFDGNGNYEVFNMRNEFKGMLKENFGIKYVRKQDIIEGGDIGDNEIMLGIHNAEKLSLVVRLKADIDYGSQVTLKIKTYILRNKSMGEIRDWVLTEGVDRMGQWFNGEVVQISYEILTSFERKIIKREEYLIGDREYNLTQWVNIEYIGATRRGEDSCVVRYIGSKFPSLYWDIKNLGDARRLHLDAKFRVL